jgi:hypothetical protein
MPDEKDVNELVQRVERLERKLKIYHASHGEEIVEPLVEALETKDLQLVLREVDAKDLAVAMMGMKPKALGRVKLAMSHKAWEMIGEDVAFFMHRGVYESAVRESRRVIAGVIRALLEMGEITWKDPRTGKYGNPFERGEAVSMPMDPKVEGLDAWKKEVFDTLKN